MKKVIISLVSSFLILSALSVWSFADTDGSAGSRGQSCYEKGMPMMPPFLLPTMHQGKEMMGGPGFMPFVWRQLACLDLDEKQKDTIRAIKSKVVKDAIQKRAEIDIIELELKEGINDDSVDLTAVKAKLEKIESLRAEMSFAHIRSLENIKSKLTTDQKKKLRKMLEASFDFPFER